MVKHEKRSHVEQELAGFEKLKQQRSEIPAVTHVDYSARVQVVKKEKNRRFHALIKSFFNLTSVPMIINTSFNVRGEPIVETIDDAINCFINSGMDALCINDFVVWKKDNLHITRQHMGPLALD